MATADLVSRLWTTESGWRPEVLVSLAADECFQQARQGGDRTVLLELCQNAGWGRLWVREWMGARWSDPVPVSPPQKDFVPYSFHAIAATGSAVAVAFQRGPGGDKPWSVDVVRSTEPGEWGKAMRVVSSSEEFSRPVDFALRGADAVVVWVGHPADAQPGEVEYPVFARTLRGDGRVSADAELGDPAARGRRLVRGECAVERLDPGWHAGGGLAG